MFASLTTFFPGKNELVIGGKKIACIGAKDEGSIGAIQGGTCDVCYCDEITLYPENIIQMILSRLSNKESILFASMNPSHPDHICKRLIDMAEDDDKYYALHFSIEDNPFLPDEFIDHLRETFSGLFYKRYFLGEWCLAEGAIFDFFEPRFHVLSEPPCAATGYIAGIDFGIVNPTAAVILGYSFNQAIGGKLWVEKEYFWDPSKTQRQKTVGELADDLEHFFEDYYPSRVYVDPSAAPLKLQLQRKNIRVMDAENDVLDGINVTTNLMKNGSLTINSCCTNLIREIQGYVWDPKKTALGKDAPIKKNDHCVDALRYTCNSFMKNKVKVQPLYKPQEERETIYVDPNSYGWKPFL